MSDAVQMPASMPVVPRVAPVRPAEHVEPPKKSRSENQNSNEQRHDSGESAVLRATERQMRITHDKAARSFVYRSVEAETGDVVWQWPSEVILRRAHYWRNAEEQARHAVDEEA
jgi:uncharacterized FlaG/YvyC family protein